MDVGAGTVAGVVTALSGVKAVRDAHDGTSIVFEISSPITEDSTRDWCREEAVGDWGAEKGKEHDPGKLWVIIGRGGE